MLRWPNDQISGRTPCLPTKGLSFGTVPSALMRTTFPIRLSRFCACMRPSVTERSPCVTRSVPSRRNTNRLRKCAPRLPGEGRLLRRRVWRPGIHALLLRERPRRQGGTAEYQSENSGEDGGSHMKVLGQQYYVSCARRAISRLERRAFRPTCRSRESRRCTRREESHWHG